jgi:hypothetical protein
MYCLERDAEKLEELVLIASFADTIRPDATYAPPERPTRLIATDVFCSKASGQADLTWTVSGDTFNRRFVATDYSWDRGQEFVQPGKSGGVVVFGWVLDIKGGHVQWTASGSVGKCNYSGDDTRAISAGDPAMLLAVMPFCITVPRGYAFTGYTNTDMKFKATEVCTEPASTKDVEFDAMIDFMFESLAVPIFVPSDQWSKWTVETGGTSIKGDGSFAMLPEGVTGTWSVTSTP